MPLLLHHKVVTAADEDEFPEGGRGWVVVLGVKPVPFL